MQGHKRQHYCRLHHGISPLTVHGGRRKASCQKTVHEDLQKDGTKAHTARVEHLTPPLQPHEVRVSLSSHIRIGQVTFGPFLSPIKRADSASCCRCDPGDPESVRHILPNYPLWAVL